MTDDLAELYDANPAVRAILDCDELSTRQRTDALNRLVGGSATPAPPGTLLAGDSAPQGSGQAAPDAPGPDDPANWTMAEYAKRRGMSGISSHPSLPGNFIRGKSKVQNGVGIFGPE